MVAILIKIVVISFWVMGFCCTFWDGMVFSKIDKYLEKKWPDYIRKPLYACFICACFWWGIVIYSLFFWYSFQEMFLVIIASMGLNATIAKLAPIEKD